MSGLADGEALLWRERRAPPFMEFTIAVAAVLAVVGVAAQNFVFTPLALVAAVAVVVFGRRFAAGHYLEDQLLTDRRVVVVPRVGTAYGLPLDDVESVELRGTKALVHGRRARVALQLRAPAPGAPQGARDGRAAHLVRAALGSELRRVRLALVAAPCARMAIAALTAACLLPAAATAADLRPCASGARCGSVTVPLLAADPAAGSVSVGFEVYAHRRGGKARDTILVSAGSDGVPTTAGRAALLALLEPLRDRRDIVLVDARGTGPFRPGRRAARRLRRGRRGRGPRRRPQRARHRPRRALRRGRRRAHRARLRGAPRRPPARARARRRPARDAASAATAATRRTRWRVRSGGARPSSRSSPRVCARTRCTPTAGSTTTCSRASPPSGDAQTLARAARAPRPPPCAAMRCRSRDSWPRTAPGASRQAAQARASSCHDDAAPARQRAGRRRAVQRRDLAARPRARRLQGLAAAARCPTRCCRPAPRWPARPRSCSRASSTCAPRPRRCARSRRSCPRARSCACAAPAPCPRSATRPAAPATLARAFLQTRGRVSPACASRRTQALGVRAFPATLAAAPAALHDATAHGRDRSTLADRRAATAAALGVADALAGAEAPGAPARVPGLRGGSALVTRRADAR